MGKDKELHFCCQFGLNGAVFAWVLEISSGSQGLQDYDPKDFVGRQRDATFNHFHYGCMLRHFAKRHLLDCNRIP